MSDFVHDILILEDVQVTTPFVLPLFANGTPTLLFQTVKGRLMGGSNHLTLFGQTVFPETLTLEDDFTLIAYFFKPHTLFALFGVSATELTDHPIELNLLGPSKQMDLQERLLNAGSTDAMMHLIDDYILNLAMKVRAETQLIQYATAKLTQMPSEETLLRVQQDLGMTERTFQRLFQKHVGVPPNRFRRIAQFSAALKQLQQGKFDKLSDIAYDRGYADQSHFGRSFREFTNITPMDYLSYGMPEDR